MWGAQRLAYSDIRSASVQARGKVVTALEAFTRLIREVRTPCQARCRVPQRGDGLIIIFGIVQTARRVKGPLESIFEPMNAALFKACFLGVFKETDNRNDQ